MEVFSIIFSDKKAVGLFHHFIYTYPNLKLKSEDSDTAYFINTKTKVSEIYFHYLVVDEEEYQSNYTASERKKIQDFFMSAFFIIDLQYRDEFFLQEILKDFLSKNSNILNSEKIKILYSHSQKGIFDSAKKMFNL
ncbi:hypothetical protein D3C87_498690 [compost metagenome]